MTIIYEINPPKIPQNNSQDELDSLISRLEKRVDEISDSCDGIHVTDSVLGTNRVSAISMGKLLKEKHPNLQITISLRVRDKDIPTLEKIVDESISTGLDGVLVLMGDPSKDNPKNSGLIPSGVVKHFMNSDFKTKTKFYLSLPSNPDFNKIRKKIESEPAGFMTQVIHSKEQVSRVCDELRPKGFRIIPCVLLPSEKNSASAKFLNLDWSAYKENPVDFIKEIHKIAGDVLITSPNDFAFAKETLSKI